MTASSLRLRTSLLTFLPGVFAVSSFMACFTAEVQATFQLKSADLTAFDFIEPTLLIFQSLLTTDAILFNEKRTLWARFVVIVAIVRDLWMSACLGSFTFVST